MNSCLYECHVMHARFSPRPHRFLYRIFLFAIDLDELETLPRRLTWFSVGRRNLYSFRDQDFLPTDEKLHNAATGQRDDRPSRRCLVFATGGLDSKGRILGNCDSCLCP